MAVADIYRKTDRGQAEISSRKLKLNPRVRTMLILIDGSQPEFLVKEEGDKVGAPPDFLDQLVGLGLVEKAGRALSPAPTAVAANEPSANAPDNEFERFRIAKDFMNV